MISIEADGAVDQIEEEEEAGSKRSKRRRGIDTTCKGGG
jgi:hypothetical protein